MTDFVFLRFFCEIAACFMTGFVFSKFVMKESGRNVAAGGSLK